jgi:hypothetical protein
VKRVSSCVALQNNMVSAFRFPGCRFAHSVSRQRLGKHVPTSNNGRRVSVDEYYSSLLGNSQLADELAG